MKTFNVEVSWTMIGAYTIQAETEEDARKQAEQAPLPDGEFLSDSFQIDLVREEEHGQ